AEIHAAAIAAVARDAPAVLIDEHVALDHAVAAVVQRLAEQYARQEAAHATHTAAALLHDDLRRLLRLLRPRVLRLTAKRGVGFACVAGVAAVVGRGGLRIRIGAAFGARLEARELALEILDFIRRPRIRAVRKRFDEGAQLRFESLDFLFERLVTGRG